MRWKFRVAARGRGSSTLARPVIAPCLTKSVWQFVFDDPSPPRVAARGIADGKRYFHDRPRLVCDSSAREICFPAYGASFSRGEEGGRIVSDDVLNFPTSLRKFRLSLDDDSRSRLSLDRELKFERLGDKYAQR